MRKFISTAVAVAMLATSSVAMVGTSEARNRDRDRHHYYDNHNRDHYYDRRHHRRDRGNNAAGAAILGFALGAIVGSQANRSYSRDSNYDHVRRCEARYRSYDRRTDTFIGRDGREYYCNL